MAMDRRVFVARRLVAVALVALATLGVREALAQSGDSLLQGASRAGGCAALSVGYVVDYVPALRGYGVTGAELTGMEPECEGRTVRVTFTSDDGSLLARATARIAAPRTAVVLADPAAIDASRVAGVSVAVLG